MNNVDLELSLGVNCERSMSLFPSRIIYATTLTAGTTCTAYFRAFVQLVLYISLLFVYSRLFLEAFRLKLAGLSMSSLYPYFSLR